MKQKYSKIAFRNPTEPYDCTSCFCKVSMLFLAAYIETSPLVCKAKWMTGFCMSETLNQNNICKLNGSKH